MKIIIHPPLFTKQKTNLPKNPSKELKTCLGAIKSEIRDPQNRNQVRPNLPPGELKALTELINLQKTRQIQIKPADKGAGICILDFDDYWESCMNHLSSKQLQSEGNYKPYYSAATEEDVTAAKKEIFTTLEKAFKDKLISEEEFKAMNPMHMPPSKFYQIYKVHKNSNSKIPPERPIVSTCGSFTERIGQYVQHHLKSLSNIHPSYLQDSPDFLRAIEEEINANNLIEDGDILVTVDVSALYTNIPQDAGIAVGNF